MTTVFSAPPGVGRRRLASALCLLLIAGCRQATPAEVGTQTTRDAHPMATMQASGRAHDASGRGLPSGGRRDDGAAEMTRAVSR